MPERCHLEEIRCRYCGRELVIFNWEMVVTACCSNPECRAYKQSCNTKNTGTTKDDHLLSIKKRPRKSNRD